MPLDPDVKIDAVQRHVEELERRANQGATGLSEVMPEAFQELYNTLEELRVTEQELRQQNEELFQAQQQLETERRRYRELFEFAPDGYLSTNQSGTICEANRAAAEMLRVNPERLAGKPLIGFIDPARHGDFRDRLDRLVREMNRLEWEVPVQPRHGEPFSAALKAVVAQDAQGRLVGLRWMVRDVTRRVAVEEALRRERDLAETLIEAAQAIVLVLDLQGRVIRFNTYLRDLAGYDLDEVRGQDWFSLFVPEAAGAQAREAFLPTTAELHSGIVCPIRTRDGRCREVQWSNKMLRHGTDEPPTVLAVGHDITDLREAEKRAMEAQRLAAIGQMISGLSHEGRNCLQRSQACLEMLNLELRDRPSALDLIQRVQNAQNDLHRLYEEVQSYAAPLRPKPEPRSLRDILKDAWSKLQGVRAGRQATLEEAPTTLDLMCDVDPLLLRRALVNLMENSLAAARDPVRIAVSWSEVEHDGRSAIQMTVRDNGPGLTPEQQERIFEPFYTTKTHGVGLGMAVAKRIVEAHGGRIAVGSSQGPGAELHIVLPRRRP
jgi:PAS domain S-box-containing protein